MHWQEVQDKSDVVVLVIVRKRREGYASSKTVVQCLFAMTDAHLTTSVIYQVTTRFTIPGEVESTRCIPFRMLPCLY